MTYAAVSDRLKALARYGSPADVKLLGRVGPSTSLFVDSIEHRSKSQSPPVDSPYGLDHQQAFRFYCDDFEVTNAVYPIACFAARYADHVSHVVPTVGIPTLLYLLMAAIETKIPGISDDIIAYWSSTPELVAEQDKVLREPFNTSPLVSVYNLTPDQASSSSNEMTIAEFLFGRSAYVGCVSVTMLSNDSFARNISAFMLNKVLETISIQTKTIARKISFAATSIPCRLFDQKADPKDTIDVELTKDAKDMLQKYSDEATPKCAHWFAEVEMRRDRATDVYAASTGDITEPTNHRLVYVQLVKQKPKTSRRSNDPDDDFDDKK